MFGHSDLSVHSLNYMGHPYMEIKRDGEPFFTMGGPKKRFQFGRYKALMLLTCMELIEEFASTEGREPERNSEICLNNGPYIPTCSCTTYDMFETSNGILVRKPYLRIESEGTHISFGVQKAEALVWAMPEIEAFVARTR